MAHGRDSKTLAKFGINEKKKWLGNIFVYKSTFFGLFLFKWEYMLETTWILVGWSVQLDILVLGSRTTTVWPIFPKWDGYVRNYVMKTSMYIGLIKIWRTKYYFYFWYMVQGLYFAKVIWPINLNKTWKVGCTIQAIKKWHIT